MLEPIQTAIEDILYRQGVEPFAVEGTEFDPRKQRAVSTQATDDPALNKTRGRATAKRLLLRREAHPSRDRHGVHVSPAAAGGKSVIGRPGGRCRVCSGRLIAVAGLG